VLQKTIIIAERRVYDNGNVNRAGASSAEPRTVADYGKNFSREKLYASPN